MQGCGKFHAGLKKRRQLVVKMAFLNAYAVNAYVSIERGKVAPDFYIKQKVTLLLKRGHDRLSPLGGKVPAINCPDCFWPCSYM